MTTLRELSNGLQGMPHIRDTKIITGTVPDDTLIVTLDDGRTVNAGFDETFEGCLLFSLIEVGETVYGDGCVELPDDPAEAAWTVHRAFLSATDLY